MVLRTRLLAVVLACSVAASGALTLAQPRAAHADGDPASDALVYTNVFTPLSFALGDPRTKALQNQATAAAVAGKPVKVAIISNAQDLGSVPVLFGKPQAYARFLAAEIVYKFVGPLVVVMPQGVAVAPVPATSKLAIARTKAAQTAIAAAKIKPGSTPAQLAVAAGKAVTAVSGVKASSQVGKTSSAPKDSSKSSGVSARNFLLGVLAIVAITLIVSIIVTLRRRRRAFAEDVIRGRRGH